MTKVKNEFAKTVKVKKLDSRIDLYPHQIDAIQELNRSAVGKEHYAGILVLPTGGGKTMTAVRWLMKNVVDKGQKVLWIAHRHALLEQALATMIDNSFEDVFSEKKQFNYRIISGIHDRPVNIKAEDDVIIASKDSINRGMDYLIKQWVKHNRNNIFLVIDEAHHAAAKTYRKTIDRLQEENPESFKVLGLTATPFRTVENENQILKKIFANDITYKIDLNTLISRGILAEPIFEEQSTKMDLSRELTDADIKNIQAFDNIPKRVAENIAKNSVRNHFIVNHYLKNKKKFGQTLIFALGIDHAIALKALFQEKGIRAEYVVSSIVDFQGNQRSKEQNQHMVEMFKSGEIEVLINVNILTEGVDIPNAETVFLTRPTISKTLMTQMIGRVLRGKKAGGTEKAYIVSFIDEWRDRIAWVNPEKIIIEEENFNEDKKGQERQKMMMRIISINKIEEFARIMDDMVDTESIEKRPFLERIPVGIYSFPLLIDGENGEQWTKNCDVLVYDHLEESFKGFIDNIDQIFNQGGLEKEESLKEYELDYLANVVKNKFFNNIENIVQTKDRDLKDLLQYFAQTGIKPSFLRFEHRNKFDLSKVAELIIDKDLGPRKKAEYIDQLWEEESSFWKVFFGFQKKYFLNGIDKEIHRILYPEDEEKEHYAHESHKDEGQTTSEEINKNQLSLNDFKKHFPEEYQAIRSNLFQKAQDKEGYYHSATGLFKSRNKGTFQIDHTIPFSKGGFTEANNLQLLSVWENRKKGDMTMDEFMDFLNKDKNHQTANNSEDITDSVQDETSKAIKEGNYEVVESAILKENNLKRNTVAFNTDMGNLCLKEDDNEKALEYFNKAIDIEPKNGDHYYNKGIALYKAGNFYESIESFLNAIKLNENDWEAMNWLGETYLKNNNYEKALLYFKRSTQIEPRNSRGYDGIGYIKLKKKLYKEANKYYKKTIKIDPENSAAYYNMGYIHEKLKDYDKALEHYNKALEIEPQNKQALKSKEKLVEKMN